MSSLAQLIELDGPNASFEVPFTPIHIEDAPRYPYRGFMLDTSRHFYKTETLIEMIDALAAAKFNVFHWHIVDDDSFPY